MNFPKEMKVIAELVQEWYDGIKTFTERCNGIFSERAQQYDHLSPSWHRHTWPGGYHDELRKKVDRVHQLLSTFQPDDVANSVRWEKLNGELADIVNYARMFASLNMMWQRRMEDEVRTSDAS